MAATADDFTDLFDRHSRAIYNYCFRRTADWSVAEDLTSAVFLEAWRRRADLRPTTARPWLFGIATNLLRNQRRSLRRHAAALRRVPPLDRELDFADDLAARIDAERRARLLVDRLGRLPRRYRDVVGLCLLAGLTYEEAAAALGVPIGTVRSRLARARRQLSEPAARGTVDPEAGEQLTATKGA
jgi:RNA polymerase sigma factor (sigma-70 family)